MQRRRVKQVTTLEERIAERAVALKALAKTLPHGSKERAAIERKARQAETFGHMQDWLASPDLQSPK